LPIIDIWFYLAALPALVIVGVSKGGFGGGLGAIAVPAMALVVSPMVALGVLLPVLCVMDLFGTWAYRRQWDRKLVTLLVVGGVIGTVLGALLLRHLSQDHIKILVGVIAVFFSLQYFLSRKTTGPVDREPTRRAGIFWGAVSGFTSFTANAGGPAVNAWLLPLKLDKTVYQATTVVFFILINYLKIVPFWMLGLFSVETFTTSLICLPFALAGLWLGIKLHDRVPVDLFYRVCFVFLLLTGIKLLFDGWSVGG